MRIWVKLCHRVVIGGLICKKGFLETIDFMDLLGISSRDSVGYAEETFRPEEHDVVSVPIIAIR